MEKNQEKKIAAEKYTSYYTFYDDFQTKTIQPPIADFENNTIPHGNVRSVIQIYRERPIFFHLRNAAFRYQSSSYPIYLEDGSLLDVHNSESYPLSLKNGSLHTKYSFRYVVAVVYFWQSGFGHSLIDGMGGIIHIPNWVWSLKPVVVIGNGL